MPSAASPSQSATVRITVDQGESSGKTTSAIEQTRADDDLARHQTFLVCSVVNRPSGLISSTTTMIR